jgi:hypothetical protein
LSHNKDVINCKVAGPLNSGTLNFIHLLSREQRIAPHMQRHEGDRQKPNVVSKDLVAESEHSIKSQLLLPENFNSGLCIPANSGVPGIWHS